MAAPPRSRAQEEIESEIWMRMLLMIRSGHIPSQVKDKAEAIIERRIQSGATVTVDRFCKEYVYLNVVLMHQRFSAQGLFRLFVQDEINA